LGLATCAAACVWVGPAIQAADPAPPRPEPSKPVAGLTITLDAAAHGVVEVSLQNVERTPIFLNLGESVGGELYPEAIHLVVTDKAGKPRTLKCGPPAIIGGVDDFLVPLMPKAKYTLRLALDDFDGPPPAAGETVQAVYRGSRPLNPVIRGFNSAPIYRTEKVESAPAAYAE
jgi:hypothetical protein